MPKLDIRSKQHPVGACLTKRHSDAAGVHNSNSSDHTIELHVCVTADHEACAHVLERSDETILWCQASKTLRFASRSAMAKENFVQTCNLQTPCLGPIPQNIVVLRMDLICGPAQDLSKRFRKWFAGCGSPVGDPAWIWRADLGKHCKLTIAVNKLHWNVEPHQESERFIRHRTRENVAADYDLIDSRTTHILENSLQRRKVSMNVAECRNSHLTPQLFTQVSCPPNS